MPLPSFLVPDSTVHANGVGGTFDVGESAPPLLLTFGVMQMVEQESLLLSIEGSRDGAEWEPAAGFPEKFYRGTSAVYVDPAAREYRYLRAYWKVNRWGRGDKTPSFRFYVFVEAV